MEHGAAGVESEGLSRNRTAPPPLDSYWLDFEPSRRACAPVVAPAGHRARRPLMPSEGGGGLLKVGGSHAHTGRISTRRGGLSQSCAGIRRNQHEKGVGGNLDLAQCAESIAETERRRY